MERKIIHINNIKEINNAAKEFISLIKNNKIFALHGDMGAGKTTFIKAVCEELNVEDIVTSPTFSIINEYDIINSSQKVFHFDLYRLKSEEEALNLGLEEYFYSKHICFIEWPEIIEHLLPENTINLTITANEKGERTIVLE